MTCAPATCGTRAPAASQAKADEQPQQQSGPVLSVPPRPETITPSLGRMERFSMCMPAMAIVRHAQNCLSGGGNGGLTEKEARKFRSCTRAGHVLYLSDWSGKYFGAEPESIVKGA